MQHGIFGRHADAESQGAHRMDHGSVLGKKRIECTLEAKFALVVGGIVTKDGSLDIHDRLG